MDAVALDLDGLAARAGVRADRVREILFGATDVTVDEADALARALGHSAAELLGADTGDET